eukprot:CAMPEP_0202902990 /NCGR_PEP_ID=MMETSP1392-20130828/20211_1 /ASSEMBLY_ACC=CAM_ASM_000868 /TAXON_ID=225041 /ORGANISM="Chlamydomonas chlamydogama, Strain SAG 11-48b" /LENGTH=52 /DNA_ID=CAMNT_0049589925 /DNA_START=314 /DNA_END=469 /DNA_ORIENTATION=-
MAGLSHIIDLGLQITDRPAVSGTQAGLQPGLAARHVGLQPGVAWQHWAVMII